MLTIRPAQMKALADENLRTFEKRAVGHLAEQYPQELKQRGRDTWVLTSGSFWD